MWTPMYVLSDWGGGGGGADSAPSGFLNAAPKRLKRLN